MNPVDSLKAVLCGQDGKCCIAGSEADRKAVDEALAALDTAQPVQVNAMLVDALEQAKRWHQGDKWRDDPDNRSVWEDHMTVLNTAIAAAQQAQPERAPITDEYLESLREKDFRFSHGIKQGGQHD